jgi:hypothetical protein
LAVYHWRIGEAQVIETPDRHLARRRLTAGWASALMFLVFPVALALFLFSLAFSGGHEGLADSSWERLALLAPPVVAVGAAIVTLGVASRYWNGKGGLLTLLLWAALAVGPVVAWLPVVDLVRNRSF